METESRLLQVGVVSTTLIATGAAGAWLAGMPPRPRRSLGRAGLRRTQALETSLAFRLSEPAIRLCAAQLARIIPDRWQQQLAAQLRSADHPLGLDACEWLALSLLQALAGALLGGLCGQSLGAGAWAPCAGAVLLGTQAFQRVGHTIALRQQAIDRGLPATIELLAMAMDAGLDFNAALAQVVGPGSGHSVLVQELSQVREALELGHTRRRALEEFAQRVPTTSVRQLVAAIIQGQESGSPMVSVLRIQATALQGRRSVLAEEAAARAALMLTVPMMMMLCCVLLLLMGPVVLTMGAS